MAPPTFNLARVCQNMSSSITYSSVYATPCNPVKVLIFHKQHKQIVTIQEPEKSLAEIRKIASSKFQLDPGSILVQYYDLEFEEYVDMPDDHVSRDKEKVQIVERIISRILPLEVSAA